MAKVSYQIKNDADYTSDSVLLSSGDMFQGSALSNMSEGLCMTDIMTKMGFASMEIGNHEFDWGTDKIVAEEKKASFPFLGINIYSKTTGKIADFAKPSTIVYRGEAKIGIIGSIYQNISGSISANKITDIDFKDDAPLVNAEAKRLKEEEKCDLVILSTHQGYSSLPYAIGASAYIDGVFGGHDHLATNDYMSNQKYFLEAGSSGKYIAKMVFTLNNGKYEASSGYYTQTDLTSDGDASVQSIIDDYNVKIGPVKNTVIGTRDGELVRYASSANTSKYGSLNKLVVNAMMYYARVTCNDSTVVCAFHNYGGVRADMQGTTLNASGTYDITIGDLYTVSPFDNLVQKIKILGSNLTAASSSLSFSSDELKKVNNTWYLSGTEVVADQYYWVTTIDYMITKPGQPLYTTDAASVQNISGYQSFIRDVVTSYIQHLGTVRVADLNFNSTCTYK
jgi:2',3'-cyclic-nucleotide 2'-phosphodiesterase/3'-nucleotidase/5'-nucleotidase